MPFSDTPLEVVLVLYFGPPIRSLYTIRFVTVTKTYKNIEVIEVLYQGSPEFEPLGAFMAEADALPG